MNFFLSEPEMDIFKDLNQTFPETTDSLSEEKEFKSEEEKETLPSEENRL